MPHLIALSIASGVAALALAGVQLQAVRLERQYVLRRLASGEDSNPASNPGQSLALQRCALQQPEILPFYGSSELRKAVRYRADLFFHGAPTGFSVFPVGKAGTFPLIMLQNLAGAGSALRERKIVISLSSGWFRTDDMLVGQYRGNFVPSVAAEFLFNANLSPGLRRAAAKRMVRFSKTLERDPVAAFAANCLARNSLLDRLAYAVVWPFGRLRIRIMRFQDHFEVARAAWHADERVVDAPRTPAHLNWPRLFAAASRFSGDTSGEEIDPAATRRGPLAGDSAFIRSVQDSPLWDDLELLLRGLDELGARPLILCTPLNGPNLAKAGVSLGAREIFHDRLRRAIAAHHLPLRDFAEHDADRHFENDDLDHLSPKGWMYYNQAIEEFVHRARASGEFGSATAFAK